MKLKAAILSVALMATPANAGETFFSVDVQPGPFMVYGVKGTKDPRNNPACYAEVKWRDGSVFQFTRDLHDGEVYIYIRNNSWSINDQPGLYDLRVNFWGNGGLLRGLNFQYTLVNKNTIVIRNIKKDLVLPLFAEASKMEFIMPGTIQNAQLDLIGSTRALNEIGNCVDRSQGLNLWPEGQPGTNNNSNTFNRI